MNNLFYIQMQQNGKLLMIENTMHRTWENANNIIIFKWTTFSSVFFGTFNLTTYLYLLRVCDPCIYPIRVPPLQKPLLCPEPMLKVYVFIKTENRKELCSS